MNYTISFDAYPENNDKGEKAKVRIEFENAKNELTATAVCKILSEANIIVKNFSIEHE